VQLKKMLLIALIAFGAWNYYQKQSVAQPVTAAHEQVILDTVPINKAREAPSSMPFRCDGRQHCSQMTSREEAEFFLRNCPDTKMDGDNDGIPCENDSRW
jgi:hypothetical protein